MQNSENNLKKEKRKYVKNQLIKLGFLTDDNIEGYSEDRILLLVDYLIEIKEKEKKLLSKEKEQYKKRENHFLYSDLLNNIANNDTEKLKDNILKKTKLKCSEKEYNYFKNFIKNNYPKKLEILRSIIRINRNYSKVPQEKFQNILNNYERKLCQIADYINDSSNELSRPINIINFNYVNKVDEEKISSKILHGYYDFLNVKFHFDAMIQVIIYDVLHESFNKETRDTRYNKIYNFLDSYYNSIKECLKDFKTKASKNIFFDFFIFLLYYEEVSNWKENIKIEEEINEISYFNKINPIDKYTQLEYAIEKSMNNSGHNTLNYTGYIFISNFEEFPELFDLMNENGLIEFEKLKKFKKEDISKTKENEIIYGKKKIKNNYDRIKEALLDFIKKYPIINEKNLQVLKASINAIENYESLIKPFRKKLMTCVLDPELRYSKTVIKYLRKLITKGIYYEKGIPEEFIRATLLQKIILNISIEISNIRSEEIKREFFGEFFYKFYQTMDDIYKNIPIYNFFTENLYDKMKS